MELRGSCCGVSDALYGMSNGIGDGGALIRGGKGDEEGCLWWWW